MAILPPLRLAELVGLRRDIHRHPELGYEERRTAALVTERLESWGFEVHRGLGRTGVVGVLSCGDGPAIALRADMDALPLEESVDRPHRSTVNGVMHACGHDGHVAMLLGAARCLAERRAFRGTAVLVFQPAEEGGGGALRMIEEGLLDRFPVRAVYGLHNRSGLAFGTFSTRVGNIMAATDNFEIAVDGRGAHAARPHAGVDAVVAAAEAVGALQSIVAREINPLDSAVISTTWIEGGSAFNILPDRVTLRGCIRYHDPSVGAHLREAIPRVAGGVCAAHRAECKVTLLPGYPPVVNTQAEVQAAVRAASQVVGPDRVEGEGAAMMGAEDFAYYLERVPGAFMFLGIGDRAAIHRSDYDFDDDLIPLGVEFWVRLVEQELPA